MKGLYVYDNEASGLLEEENLYYHCTLFKEYAIDNWILFLDFSHPELDVAKKFIESDWSIDNLHLVAIVLNRYFDFVWNFWCNFHYAPNSMMKHGPGDTMP